MNKKHFCRCCKQKKLKLYLNLGKQPLANSYVKKKTNLKTYPLEVMLCQNCFHSQLSFVVNPEKMFKNYLYVSGTTKTLKDHFRELAKDAVKRFKKKNLSVLDIACNDGSQLEFFKELGCSVYGVDPAENLREITKQKKIPVMVDYWNTRSAKKINKSFDIMTATNVFAHVDDLDEFLKGVKIALKKDGLLILEFPYADNMVKYNEFDTVYHEHLSYFLVNSFKALMERMEFTIVDLLQTKIHGGSIRFFVKAGKGTHNKKVDNLIRKEEKNGLLKSKTYSDFSKRVKKNKKDMINLIKKLIKKNKKIIGYGASAKGNTMLNYFKISPEYIVDDNPLKWDYLTPGRNIPIKTPQVIKDEKRGLGIIILSWNFYKEIIKKIVKLHGKNSNDICVIYIPSVKTLPVEKPNLFLNSA